MSDLHASALGDLTRGGQLFLNFMRMLTQLARKFAGAMIVMTALVSVAVFLARTDSYERYLGCRYALAWVEVKALRDADRVVFIERRDGSRFAITPHIILTSPAVRAIVAQLQHTAVRSTVVVAAIIGGLFVFVVAWVWRSGSMHRLETHIRGAQIVEQKELSRLLRHKNKASDLHIAGVPLLRGSETSHLLITGSPGTGKSTAIHELLTRIRARGDRCICFSPSGDFIQWFYREGEDRVLNPFDARCPSWDLWEECEEPFHHDMIAAAVVPDPARAPDPFWNIAARSVLAALTQVMGDRGERGVSRLLELLTQVDLDALHEYLRGTEAAALLDPNGERTAVSIRTTTTTYARAFRYLPDGREPFHIRRWVLDDSRRGWMFLNAQRDQIDSVRPLLSAWLEVFTNALTSLPPSRTRRIWLVIDELHSLNRIPSLSQFLAEARKYGGCAVIAFHQVAQLRERYGRDAADTLTGGCATWVCLRQNDPETAKWIAGSFGQIEVFEAHQGLSYGANDVRDGVSLSRVRKTRPLLLDSEIAKLDDLEGYIRVPGRLPIGHFRQQWRKPNIVAPAYIAAPKGEFAASSVAALNVSALVRSSMQAPEGAELPESNDAPNDPTLPGLFDDPTIDAPPTSITDPSQ